MISICPLILLLTLANVGFAKDLYDTQAMGTATSILAKAQYSKGHIYRSLVAYAAELALPYKWFLSKKTRYKELLSNGSKVVMKKQKA